MIKDQINKDYLVRYFLLHGREDSLYDDMVYDFNYDIENSIIKDENKKPKTIQLYSINYMGNLFESKFMQYFSQIEISLKKSLRKKDNFVEFIKSIITKDSIQVDDDFFQIINVNDIDFSVIAKYRIYFHYKVKRNRDCEFFIINKDDVHYFYVTKEKDIESLKIKKLYSSKGTNDFNTEFEDFLLKTKNMNIKIFNIIYSKSF